MGREGIEALIGQYAWLLIAGFLFLIGRKSIESAIEAIKVFAGGDLNTDDVIIFDERPARVVRVGLWKTILFVFLGTIIAGATLVSSCRCSIKTQ